MVAYMMKRYISVCVYSYIVRVVSFGPARTTTVMYRLMHWRRVMVRWV